MIDHYLVAIEGAGERGFQPIGWLYASILDDYCARGLMWCDGYGAFRLTWEGRAELARQRAAEPPEPEVAT